MTMAASPITGFKIPKKPVNESENETSQPVCPREESPKPIVIERPTKMVEDDESTNISQKKPQYSCDICKSEFTGQIVLQAHLTGAKHKKQLKKKEILESISSTGNNYHCTFDEETENVKCNPCNLYLNSLQQLETHLNGQRHKKKISKGDWPAQEPLLKKAETKQEATDVEMPLAESKTLPQAQETAPPVPAAPPAPPAPPVILTCDPCNKIFNSPQQMKEHVESSKHLKKVIFKRNSNNVIKKVHVKESNNGYGKMNPNMKNRKFGIKKGPSTFKRKPFVPPMGNMPPPSMQTSMPQVRRFNPPPVDPPPLMSQNLFEPPRRPAGFQEGRPGAKKFVSGGLENFGFRTLEYNYS